MQPYLLALMRFALSIIFVASAISKLRNQPAFVAIVLNYRVLPKHWGRRFALTLPWVELVLGLSLLFGVFTQPTAVLSGLSLLSFTVAVGINLLRGRKDLDCGCGGAKRSQKISGRIILRNVALIMLAVPLMLWARDDPLVSGWLMTGVSFVLSRSLFVGSGLPFMLTTFGLLMFALLVRQLQRFVRMEANS